jgi:hypothetical protein
MKNNSDKQEQDRRSILTKLVHECIATHNEIILIETIARLEKNYIDLAMLSTLGQYKTTWTHEEVINYLTYEQLP